MLREDTEDLVQGIFSNLVVGKCGGAGGKVGVDHGLQRAGQQRG